MKGEIGTAVGQNVGTKSSLREFFSSSKRPRKTSTRSSISQGTLVSTSHNGGTPQGDNSLAIQLHTPSNSEASRSSQHLSTHQPSIPPSHAKEPVRKGPDKYGLFRLDNPARNQGQASTRTQFPVDIVALHGMNGDAFDTWTAENRNGERVNWLRDFLPEEFPGARIYTFGYPAEIFWTRGKSNITDAARNLLQSLVNVRFERHEQRPIIFIGHSMGGLVIKKALNICVTDGREYTEIMNSVKSIFFFATPHGGSAVADSAASFAAIANFASLGLGPFKSSYFKTLKIDSRELYDISLDFRYRAAKLNIYSFLEERAMVGFKLIVTQANGSIGSASETLVPMVGCDHRSIVRFEDKEANKYKSVIGPLKRVVKEVLSIYTDTIRAEDEPCLQSLSFPSLLARLDDIQQQSRDHQSTCTWILEQKNYKQWMSLSQGLLWIKGDPGTGKSTLMAFIYHHVLRRIEPGPQSICISFFFDGNGMSLQKSQLGLFRSLLLQFYRRSIMGREIIFKAFEEKKKSFGAPREGWDWQLSELKELFLEVAVQTSKETELVILVDALDEAADDGAGRATERLVDYFHRLNDRVSANHGRAKICISCRHYPNVSIGNALQIIVEEHNGQALREFVVRELQAHLVGWEKEPEDKQNDLVGMIATKAESQFLWASERIPLLVDGWNDGESLVDIYKMLEAETSKLSALYEKILTTNVAKSKRSEAFLMLQWVCFAERPLSLTEIRYAMACREDLVAQGLESCEGSESFVESDDRMEKLTKSLSGGLAVVRNHGKERYIRFTHQSFYEFLKAGGLQLLSPNSDITAMSTNEALGMSEETISKSCLYYLMSFQIIQLIECWEQGEEKDFPFIEYATINWRHHAARSDSYGRSQVYLSEFFQSREGSLEAVTKIYDMIFHTKDRFDLTIGCHLLNIAASANIPSLARHLLATGNCVNEISSDSNGNTPLHYAARWGHQEIVVMLLDANANTEATNFARRTAMELAAEESHVETVKLLLLKSADINGKPNFGYSLQLAAMDGHLPLLKLLIESGADVNSTEKDATPLQVAAFHRHEAAVRLLVSKGAKLDITGRYGTALQAAVGWIGGEEEMSLVRFLLDEGANINVPGGGDGNAVKAALINPLAPDGLFELLLSRGADVHAVGGLWGTCLQAAAHKGNAKHVKILLAEGVDVNELGGSYGSALHATPYAPIARLLIDNGADAQLYTPEWGCVLQATAHKGTEDKAKLLLDMGLDVNRQGGRYGNPLMAAVSGKCGPPMIKLLLDHGADINAPGKKFGSPLEAAVYFQWTVNVQVLLSRGANVQSNGTPTGKPPMDLLQKYRTYLQIAAFRGCLKTVKILLDFGVDINERGPHGGALEAAISTGQTQVVECLLDRGIRVDCQIIDHCLEMAQGKKALMRILLAQKGTQK